jgi:hypothetical protein
MKRIIIITLLVLGSLSLFGQKNYKYQIKANGGLSVGTGKVKLDSIAKSGTNIKFYNGSTQLTTLTYVGDTTSPVKGKIVFKTSDSTYYGCRSTTYRKKWYSLH